ncbi:type III secretion system translocon subunit SctB [Aquabacterium sp.]|uniref:type III secretion system translocon subunit SctB n=1 Tax=Aquabacterium sp. TaxID=1872578 RepID=UPI002C27E130|nr:type III secretion system translocon subunit SctB [Aquabacterium sp.]HSW06939.1 type III secretion system translocon subunit SctB [Aquabacterium sp.]
MGPKAIDLGSTGGVSYGAEEPLIEGLRPAAPGLSPEQIAELQLALSAIDGGPDLQATRGVASPREGERVDPVALHAALDSAESDVSTDIYAFMALFTKMAQEMRKTAKEQRQTELQAQVSAINSAADKMVDAAEKRFAAAVVQGTVQAVGGAISIGSGVGTFRAAKSASGADLETGSKFLTQLGAKQGIASGSGQVLSGLGSIVSGGIEMSASLDDAEAKRLEADGTAAQARRESSQEIAQNMSDLIKDIREQLRAMSQSNIETNRGMARNI